MQDLQELQELQELQAPAPSPVDKIQPRELSDTASLLESLMCHETMPFQQGDEFDATEWAMLNADIGMFFASYVNGADTSDKNAATQLVLAEQAWC